MATVREYLSGDPSPSITSQTPADRTYNGCFPLHFTARTGARSAGKDYTVENIIRDDDSVWSTVDGPPAMVLFDTRNHDGVTVTEIYVRCPPFPDYNSPASVVEFFLFSEPSGTECLSLTPLAKLAVEFSFANPKRVFARHVFTRPVSNVKSVLLLVKETHTTQPLSTNVDLQYVAFGGFYASHAFPHASLI